MSIKVIGYNNLLELVENLSKYPEMLIIFPTQKKAHFVKNQLMNYLDRPGVFSLSELLWHQYQKLGGESQKISPAQELLIMERVIEENWISLDFFSQGEPFPGLAAKIKRVFDFMAQERMEISDLGGKQEKKEDLQLLNNKYYSFLNEKNLIDANSLGRMGKDLVKNLNQEWKMIGLDTLNYLTPLDWEIIREIEKGFSERFLFSDLPEILPEGDSFYTRLKDFNKKNFGIGEEEKEKCNPVMVFFNPEEEVRAVARNLRENLNQGFSEKDLFVIPASIEVYQPLIREIFPQFDLSFDISIGIPLEESPGAIILKTFLDLVKKPFSRQLIYRFFSNSLVNLEGLDIELIDSFSRRFNFNDLEPFFQGEIEVGSLISGEEAGSVEEQFIVLDKFIKKILDPLKSTQDFKKYFNLLRELFKEIAFLDKTISPKEDMDNFDPREISIGLRKLFEVLNEAEALFEEGILLKGNLQDRAGHVLKRLIAEKEFYIPSQAGGVQVTGILNMRGWPAEKVYFMGAISDNFPSRPERNFLMEGKGSSHVLREAKLFFHHLINSSREINITLPAFYREKETQPSPLLKNFEFKKGLSSLREGEIFSLNDMLTFLAENKERDFWKKWAAPGDIRNFKIEWERENNEDSIFNGFLGPGLDFTPNPISVTSLEGYWRCPFYYFMQWILNVEVLSEVEEEEELTLFGIHVHKILETFGKTGGFDLLRDDFLKACFKLREIALSVLEEEEIDLSRNLFIQGQYNNWLRGLGSDEKPEGVFVRFLKAEKERLKEFSPLEFETGLERKGQNPSLGPFNLTGRVDRLDEFNGEEIMIYDYKTGGVPQGKEIRAFKNLQLPLYVLALKNHPDLEGKDVLGGYYQLRHREKPALKPLIGDNLGNSFHKASVISLKDPELQKKYEEVLIKIKKGLDEGDFKPTNWSREDAKCDYCSFRTVCRRTGHQGEEDFLD